MFLIASFLLGVICAALVSRYFIPSASLKTPYNAFKQAKLSPKGYVYVPNERKERIDDIKDSKQDIPLEDII